MKVLFDTWPISNTYNNIQTLTEKNKPPRTALHTPAELRDMASQNDEPLFVQQDEIDWKSLGLDVSTTFSCEEDDYEAQQYKAVQNVEVNKNKSTGTEVLKKCEAAIKLLKESKDDDFQLRYAFNIACAIINPGHDPKLMRNLVKALAAPIPQVNPLDGEQLAGLPASARELLDTLPAIKFLQDFRHTLLFPIAAGNTYFVYETMVALLHKGTSSGPGDVACRKFCIEAQKLFPKLKSSERLARHIIALRYGDAPSNIETIQSSLRVGHNYNYLRLLAGGLALASVELIALEKIHPNVMEKVYGVLQPHLKPFVGEFKRPHPLFVECPFDKHNQTVTHYLKSLYSGEGMLVEHKKRKRQDEE